MESQNNQSTPPCKRSVLAALSRGVRVLLEEVGVIKIFVVQVADNGLSESDQRSFGQWWVRRKKKVVIRTLGC